MFISFGHRYATILLYTGNSIYSSLNRALRNEVLVILVFFLLTKIIEGYGSCKKIF